MKMKEVSKFAIVTVVVALLATAIPTFASPSGGFQEREGVRESIENADYVTFATNYKERTGEELSEENFGKIVQIHKLKQELKDAGVKIPMKQGKKGKGMRMERANLTDEQKDVMGQARELRMAGDHEGAKELMESSGIEFSGGMRGQKGWRK